MFFRKGDKSFAGDHNSQRVPGHIPEFERGTSDDSCRVFFCLDCYADGRVSGYNVAFRELASASVSSLPGTIKHGSRLQVRVWPLVNSSWLFAGGLCKTLSLILFSHRCQSCGAPRAPAELHVCKTREQDGPRLQTLARSSASTTQHGWGRCTTQAFGFAS